MKAYYGIDKCDMRYYRSKVKSGKMTFDQAMKELAADYAISKTYYANV